MNKVTGVVVKSGEMNGKKQKWHKTAFQQQQKK
jgi:hypothetical protein